MRRPVVMVAASALLLLALAYPILHLRIGLTDISGFPKSIDGVAGILVLNEKWPQATVALDVTQIYVDGTPRIFLFVLGLSFLLMLVAFHSIVIPIKAIILNLLSTGAAFGVMVLVFRDGWLA